MEIINNLLPYITDHPYLFLFVGMLVGGETFLLPAIYLAAQGSLQFSYVLFFSALATLISDSAWYLVGRFFPLDTILSWKIFRSKREFYLKIFSVFAAHKLKLLFLSKFIYGTRTTAQVLSGSVHTPFWQYSGVNMLGIISYLIGISLLAFLTQGSLTPLVTVSHNKYASIGIFIFIVILIHICLKKWLGKNFIASSSRPGTKKEL